METTAFLVNKKTKTFLSFLAENKMSLDVFKVKL